MPDKSLMIYSIKEKEAGENITLKFSNLEIESKFQTFWSSVKDEFNSKKEKTFVAENVREKFFNEIGFKYGNVAKFKKISEKFGRQLQNKFKIEWIKFEHVEFNGNIIYRCYNKCYALTEAEFYQNMWELIGTTESKLLHNVIGLYDFGGLIKMHFQSDSAIFDCGTLVKQYLAKAVDLLLETHRESQQKNVYNLRDMFEVIFLFIAAQLAIPKFERAQQSFIDYMDISTKLDTERENVKQIFTLILKKEETLTIAAKQVAKRLHHAIKNAV